MRLDSDWVTDWVTDSGSDYLRYDAVRIYSVSDWVTDWVTDWRLDSENRSARRVARHHQSGVSEYADDYSVMATDFVIRSLWYYTTDCAIFSALGCVGLVSGYVWVSPLRPECADWVGDSALGSG